MMRSLYYVTTATLAAPLVFAWGPVQAASQSEQLDQLTVNARLIEEFISTELADYGNQMHVINADDIRRSGASDVSQALQRLAPSLYIASKNGKFDYANISLQGSRSQDVLFLVDGVRISNRLFGSTTPLDTLSASQVERIEVLKGGQSLFYGTQAMAGVVNIITKAYSDKSKGSVSVGVAPELDETTLAVDYAGKMPTGTRYVVSLSGDNADGFQPWPDEAIQPDNEEKKRGYRVTNALVKLQHDPTENSRVSLSYQRNDAKVDFARPYRNVETYNDREEEIVTLKWDQYINDQFSFFAKAYSHDWDTYYTRIENRDGERKVVDDASYWGYSDRGINAMLRYNASDKAEVVAGVDYQRYDGEDRVLLIKTKTESSTALFSQLRYEFADNTRGAVGVRSNKAKLGGTNNVWNMSLHHGFNNHLYTDVAIGTAYTLPDAYQLYSIDPEHPKGNEDLDGESSTNLNWTLGGSNHNERLKWSVTAYYRKVEDLIKRDTVEVNGEKVSTRVNSDSEVTGKGVGVVLDYALNDHWSTRMSADVNDVTFDDSDEQIDKVPESLAKVGLYYAKGPWRMGGDATYSGDTFVTLGGERERYGDEWQLDLNGQWQIDKDQSVSVRLENALDADNVSSLSRGTRVDGSRYVYENLITPRNIKLTYRLAL